MATLREQLEAELAAAEEQVEFAEKVARAFVKARAGKAFNFETALLAEGIDQLTADAIVTGHITRPSSAKARSRVFLLKARIAGLDRYEASKGASK